MTKNILILLLTGLWLITASAQNVHSGPENNKSKTLIANSNNSQSIQSNSTSVNSKSTSTNSNNSVSSSNQAEELPAFVEINRYLGQDHFFQALRLYKQYKRKLNSTERLLTEVVLNNAFNRPAASNKKIDKLIKTVTNSSPEKEHENSAMSTTGNVLSDSVLLQLYQLRADNAIKLYDYRGAKEALEIVLNSFSHILNEDQLAETNNSLTLWKALEKVPEQRIVISENNRVKIEKDKIGLSNLKINNGADSLSFIFDTGANLSTVTLSTAKKFKMTIVPAEIKVGTITGDKVNASLAYCPTMQLGNIYIHNAVFLVMEDSTLSFAQLDYQIHGILGFPVMEALGEIQITSDNWFIVPQKQSRFRGDSNLAMRGLTPLICIEGKHYSFDTGADNTLLYQAYYLDNKSDIENSYSTDSISFGGAGGKKDFEAYVITDTFNISGRSVILKDIHLLREKIKDNENVYGNIGQDLIGQFEKMTLNFSRMFIRFD